MYSAYKLNKQSDNIQTCNTVVPYPVLTVAYWPAYRFLWRQVRWSGTPLSLRIFQFVVIHTVKGFSVVNKAEVIFLEFPWFVCDLMKVHNLISHSTASLKPSCTSRNSQFTYCWGLAWKKFEHNLASMWNELNYMVVWTLFGIAILCNWNENWLFQCCGHRWVFQICWYIECSTFTASSFGIWNSSAGIPSTPLGLFIVMLPKARFDFTLHDVWH